MVRLEVLRFSGISALTDTVQGQANKEDQVKAVMNSCISSKSAGAAIKPVVEILQKSLQPPDSTGLLVDWLTVLDPGTVSAHPDLQTELLFREHVAPPTDIANSNQINRCCSFR